MTMCDLFNSFLDSVEDKTILLYGNWFSAYIFHYFYAFIRNISTVTYLFDIELQNVIKTKKDYTYVEFLYKIRNDIDKNHK